MLFECKYWCLRIKMKRIYLFWGYLFGVISVYSQSDRPLRAEIPLFTTTTSSDFYPFAVINLENQGVLVHTATGNVNKSSQNTTQEFRFFDVFLQAKWQVKAIFPAEYAVVNYQLSTPVLQLILRNQIYRNTHTPTFLMNINLMNGGYTIDTLYSLSKTPTQAGFIHQSRVWLIQTDRSECSVNTAKIGDSTLFRYEFPKFSTQEIVDALLDTNTHQLYVLHADHSRRELFFTLAVFDTLANLIESKNLRLQEDLYPVQAKFKLYPNGNIDLFGLYNIGYPNIDYHDRLMSSAGFFRIPLGGNAKIQNYADFDSVDSRISIEQTKNLQQKRNRRQQPFSLDLFTSFQLKTVENNVFGIAESLTPEYTTSTQTHYDYYGRVIPYTTTVFNGYRYNDAFVWLIDSAGNLQKNYVSDISMILNSKTLIGKTAYLVAANEKFMMFANATNVYYKLVDPNEKTYQTLRLQPFLKGDKVVEDYDTRLMNWYGHHFLVCGYQTIQNNSQRNSKRVVFYLTKVSLD